MRPTLFFSLTFLPPLLPPFLLSSGSRTSAQPTRQKVCCNSKNKTSLWILGQNFQPLLSLLPLLLLLVQPAPTPVGQLLLLLAVAKSKCFLLPVQPLPLQPLLVPSTNLLTLLPLLLLLL